MSNIKIGDKDRSGITTGDQKHSPLPWSVSGVRTRESGQRVLQIYGDDNKVYVLVLYSDRTPAEHIQSHADARLIVRAVNSHAALIEALRSSERVLTNLVDYVVEEKRMAGDENGDDEWFSQHGQAALKEVRAALAAAEKGE